MLRNFWVTAWRQLLHSPGYAAVSVLGLAVGLAVAILAGLVVRSEYSQDHFLSGYARTYLSVQVLTPPGRAPVFNELTNSRLAGLLAGRAPQIEAIARLAPQTVHLGRGPAQYEEPVYWADPGALSVLGWPVIAGDATTALLRPDSVVLTRSAAEKYFGKTRPLGEILQLDGSHPLTVTAILADLPAQQTDLRSGILLAGVSSYSELSALDRAVPAVRGGFTIDVRTYVRLKPGVSIEPVQALMPALMRDLWSHRPPGLDASIRLIRIDRLQVFPGLHPDTRGHVVLAITVGALILLIACINFVNLWSARAGRRTVEVGIRKVMGASRSALALQFLGETLLAFAIATALAVALLECLLPTVDGFIGLDAAFNYWRDPRLLAAIALGALLVGVLSGGYPALLLASAAPVRALKGSLSDGVASIRARQALIAVQFACLIGLMLAAVVFYQQRRFATQDALDSRVADMVVVRSDCRAGFTDTIEQLPGVAGVACAGTALLSEQMFASIPLRGGGNVTLYFVPVGPGLLRLYGLQPVVGSTELYGPGGLSETSRTLGTRLVLNKAAVRRLSFASPAAALGQTLTLPAFGPGQTAHEAEVIGVVPDFSLSPLDTTVRPTAYVVQPQLLKLINVQLSPGASASILPSIDHALVTAGAAPPIQRFTLRQYFSGLYDGVLRQDQTIGLFSVVTLLFVCVGMLALSAATAQRRTVEIGIRKALGANSSDILVMLARQFARPILWGSLISWPICALLLNRWLQGFVYHVGLPIWLFPLVTLSTLLIVGASISFHALALARACPIDALRYE